MVVRRLSLLLLSLLAVVAAAFQNSANVVPSRTLVVQQQQQQQSLSALSAFRVKSKKRGRVVLDPDTGFYRPEKRVGQAALSAGEQKWKKIKIAVYGAVDGIRTIKDKVQVAAGGESSEEKEKDIVVAGYVPIVTPGQRVQKKAIAAPVAVEAAPTSAFDSVKGAVYGTVDAASKLVEPKKTAPPQNQNFKPVVESARAASAVVQQALLDRGSDNPVKRAAAELKILQWESRYVTKQKGTEESLALKDTIYKVGDTLEQAIEGLNEMPDKVTEFASKVSRFTQVTSQFFTALPGRFRQVVDTVKAIPSQVEESANQVEKTVQQSIEATTQLVEDVKAIPENVQKTAKQTKESLDATVETVNELTTASKVMLGLETAVPRPPKRLPPQEDLTPAKIGWKVAGAVATGASKVAWWAGKNIASVAFDGAKLAFAKGSAAVEAQQQETNASTLVSTPPPVSKTVAATTEKPKAVSAPKAPAPVMKPTPPKPVFEKKPKVNPESKKYKQFEEALNPESKSPEPTREPTDLDRQVEEALRLATDALELANDDSFTVDK